MPKLIAIKFNLDNTFLTITYAVSLTSVILGLIFYGWLADKYSVGKVMVVGAIALIITALMFYVLLTNDSPYYILSMCALLSFLSGIRGLCLVIFVQLFPTEVRLTSVSLIYNCVSAVVGITLPISLFYCTNIMSSALGLFITFVGIVMIMIGLLVQNSPGLNRFENLVDSNQN